MAGGAARMTMLLGLALALTPAACDGEVPVVAEETNFVRLGPPKPGEWRDVFPEPVQTFEEYREQTPRPHHGRPRIAVIPFDGETQVLDDDSLRLLRQLLEAYFTTPVELRPARELPDTVRRRASRGFGTQVLADDVLEFTAEHMWQAVLSEESLARELFLPAASLGIVQTDLYASSPDGGYLDFVFGLGAPERGTAVISPARYSIRHEGQPEGITLRKRFLKVAAHELAHVFGLAHCQTYACCMNGSNSLPEADRRPINLCPECLDKLEHRLAFDRRERYQALAKLYRRLGWRKEAEFAVRRARSTPPAPARAEEVPR
jgi:archaemetzincin